MDRSIHRVLVVAGEPSGDRALASVVSALSRFGSLEVFGFGGDALSQTGARLVAHVREVSGLGLFELASRAPSIARALFRLSTAVRATPPDVALLASWSAGNARIGARLRRAGIPVVWVSPPEIWAWRAGRARRLSRCADRFAVTLPFEEALWREAGADATYVGHPALDPSVEQGRDAREALRHRCEIEPESRAIAIMPGSRPAEIARLIDPFTQSFALARARLPRLVARILLAPSLPEESRARVHAAAMRASIPVIDAPADGALSLLAAFDVALVASGTASLEAALAGVPPVVAYRLNPLTMAIAKRLVRTTHIALPNVVLMRAHQSPVFRELVADSVTPDALADALCATLTDDAAFSACDRVRRVMSSPLTDGRRFEDRVAAMAMASVVTGGAARSR